MGEGVCALKLSSLNTGRRVRRRLVHGILVNLSRSSIRDTFGEHSLCLGLVEKEALLHGTNGGNDSIETWCIIREWFLPSGGGGGDNLIDN